MMAGFLRPAAGRLAWHGASIEIDLATHRRQLRYLGHADAVKGALTVRENLTLAVALSNGEAGRIDGALERFDLAALARLLTGRRPLWLLDEPGVGLDAANRARLERTIAEHRAEGGMVALASHGDTTVGEAAELDLGALALDG